MGEWELSARAYRKALCKAQAKDTIVYVYRPWDYEAAPDCYCYRTDIPWGHDDIVWAVDPDGSVTTEDMDQYAY